MAIIWDGYVSTTDLTAFVRNVPVDQSYVLNTIFPDRYDEVFEAEFGERVTTRRAAKARAWDAPPMPGRRDSFSVSKVQLPAVSQMLGSGERDRLEAERLRQGGQNTAAMENAIYDDAQNNAESVLTRVEIMRGDLLDDGVITLPELGDLEADFGVPGTHIVDANVGWSDHANADILGDLRGWAQVYRQSNGFNFGGMILSEDVLFDFLQNTAIRELYRGVAGLAPGVLTQDQLNQTLQSYRLPPVQMVYDAKADVDGTITSILDPRKVHFVPPAGVELGRTQWGLTATALEAAAADVEIVGSPAGMIAVLDKAATPPYRETAYVDSAVMPVLSRPRGLFVATVRES